MYILSWPLYCGGGGKERVKRLGGNLAHLNRMGTGFGLTRCVSVPVPARGLCPSPCRFLVVFL